MYEKDVSVGGSWSCGLSRQIRHFFALILEPYHTPSSSSPQSCSLNASRLALVAYIHMGKYRTSQSEVAKPWYNFLGARMVPVDQRSSYCRPQRRNRRLHEFIMTNMSNSHAFTRQTKTQEGTRRDASSSTTTVHMKISRTKPSSQQY